MKKIGIFVLGLLFYSAQLCANPKNFDEVIITAGQNRLMNDKQTDIKEFFLDRISSYGK